MVFRSKRRCCLLLATALTAGLLSGCSGNGSSDGTPKKDDSGLLEYPTYQASKYVTLGDYKKLTVYADLGSTEVSEDEVMSYMESMVMPEEVEKKAEDGDIINIDFDGKVDGKSFEGGTIQAYDLQLGSHSFIDGFEEQLVGLGKGDKKTVKVTFPEGYPASGEVELANKEAVFEVTVNAVKQVPELTDEAVPDMTGGEYKTIEEYKKVLTDQMKESKEQQVSAQKDNLVIQELLDNSEFTEGGCEDLNNWYIEMNVQAYVTQAKSADKDVDEFINEYSGGQMKDEKELREALTEVAAENTKTELVVHAIAEKEKISVDKKYYKEHLDEVAGSAGFNSGEDFEKSYSKSVIENTMLLDKVLDFLGEGLTIKPADEDPDLKESESVDIEDVEVEAEEAGDADKDADEDADKNADAKDAEDEDSADNGGDAKASKDKDSKDSDKK